MTEKEEQNKCACSNKCSPTARAPCTPYYEFAPAASSAVIVRRHSTAPFAMDMLADPTVQMAPAALCVVDEAAPAAAAAIDPSGAGGGEKGKTKAKTSSTGTSKEPRIAGGGGGGGAGAFAGNGATPPASQARNRLALLRVMGKEMQFFAPQSKRALAACVLVLPEPEPDPPHNLWTLSVEAVGSGTVIAPALRVDPDSTIAALRTTVANLCAVSTLLRIRLLVGQGGPEMDARVDALALRASAVTNGATVVVVVKDCKAQHVSVCVCESERGCVYVRVCVCLDV